MLDFIDLSNDLSVINTSEIEAKDNSSFPVPVIDNVGLSFGSISGLQGYRHYVGNSAVSTAVRKIAEKFSCLEPIIMQDKKIITDHKVLKFLEKPNIIGKTYANFAKSISINYLLSGNSYLEITGNINAEPSQLFALRTDKVTLQEFENSLIYTVDEVGISKVLSGEFKWDRETGRNFSSDPVESKTKELFHIFDFNLASSGIEGDSVLTAILKNVNIMDETDCHNLESLLRKLSTPGIFSLDTNDTEYVDKFRELLVKNYSSTRGLSRPLVAMAGSMEYKQIDKNNRDMQVNETKRDSKNTVYQGFEIPLPLIDGNHQTLSNFSVAELSLLDNAILPLAKVLFSHLTIIFKDRNMLKDNEKISFDPSSVTGLNIRLAQEIDTMKKSEAFTTNELRTRGGFEPKDEANDILVSRNRVPLGQTNEPNSIPKTFFNTLKSKGIPDAEIVSHWKNYEKTISQE